MVQNSSRISLLFKCSYTSSSIPPQREDITSITSYKMRTLLTRFHNLKVLSIVGWFELSCSDLLQLSLCGTTLRALYLRNCFQITDYGVWCIAFGCPFLSNICLSRTNVTDTGLYILSESCPLLKRVNLSECHSITDTGIRYLTLFCRELYSLNISYCKTITGIGFKDCPETLTLLEAESCNLLPEGIMEIVSGANLEYLNLSFLRNVDGLTAIGSGLTSTLRVLDLMMSRLVGDEIVIAIAEGCCLLQELSLAFCVHVGLPGWKSIGLNCQNLERLHVFRCTNLCEVGLQSLRDGCSRLSILYTGSPSSRLSLLARETFESQRPDVELNHQQNVGIFPIKGFYTS